jgi:hypothetical protein
MTALRKPITKGQVMPLTVSDEMIDAGMVPFNAPEKYRDARRYIEGIYLAMEAARPSPTAGDDVASLRSQLERVRTLTPELADILGRPNFTFCGAAQLYRKAGRDNQDAILKPTDATELPISGGIEGLIERLREHANPPGRGPSNPTRIICNEAATALSTLQSRLERVTEAHRAILAIDGPYCDSCHSQEICEAFRISKQALSTQDEAGEGR